MARPPRIDFPDAVYHVTSRGNGRDVIFWSDTDRERFLCQLADSLRTTAVVLYAYVLMDNHIHLLVRTPRANLSRFMQRLLTSYALYARYKHRRPGHQLQGRFKAKLVDDDTYLLAVTRYIHSTRSRLPPPQTRPPRAAAAAERLSLEQLSRLCRGQLAQEFVSYDVLKEYATDLADARRQYRAYAHACLLEDDAPILEAMAASRYAIGNPRFVERMEQRVESRRSGRLQDKDLAFPHWTVSLGEIDAAVARHFKLDAERLQKHGHSAGTAKAVAVELACRLTGMTQREIGEHYGGIGAAAVSATHRKAKRQDHAARAAVDALFPRLTSARRRKIDN